MGGEDAADEAQADAFFADCHDPWSSAAALPQLHAWLAGLRGGSPGVLSRPLAVVTSGGTTVPLERRCVRYIDNFSKGTRGALSTEQFLQVRSRGDGERPPRVHARTAARTCTRARRPATRWCTCTGTAPRSPSRTACPPAACWACCRACSSWTGSKASRWATGWPSRPARGHRLRAACSKPSGRSRTARCAASSSTTCSSTCRWGRVVCGHVPAAAVRASR